MADGKLSRGEIERELLKALASVVDVTPAWPHWARPYHAKAMEMFGYECMLCEQGWRNLEDGFGAYDHRPTCPIYVDPELRQLAEACEKAVAAQDREP